MFNAYLLACFQWFALRQSANFGWFINIIYINSYVR